MGLKNVLSAMCVETKGGVAFSKGRVGPASSRVVPLPETPKFNLPTLLFTVMSMFTISLPNHIDGLVSEIAAFLF